MANWRLDTTGDPITATFTTPSGDVVYEIPAADWRPMCSNTLELKAGYPADCDPAPCVCIGPANCPKCERLKQVLQQPELRYVLLALAFLALVNSPQITTFIYFQF